MESVVEMMMFEILIGVLNRDHPKWPSTQNLAKTSKSRLQNLSLPLFCHFEVSSLPMPKTMYSGYLEIFVS